MTNGPQTRRGLRRAAQFDDFTRGQKEWHPEEPRRPLTDASTSIYAPGQLSWEQVREAEEKAKLHEAYERMMVQGLSRATKPEKESPVDDHSQRQREFMEAGFSAEYAKGMADKERAEAYMRRRTEEMQAEMPLTRAERVLDWVQDQTTGYAEGTSKYIGQAAGAGPGLLLGGIGGAAATDGSFEGFGAGAFVGGLAAATVGGS